MSDLKSRREILVGTMAIASGAALASKVYGEPSEAELNSFFQGGTNPNIKIPEKIDADTGITLRPTAYPSILDNIGDVYNVRVFEMDITKDAAGNFVIVERHEKIDGIEGGEFHTTATVTSLTQPMYVASAIKLARIPANRTSKVVVVGVYNALRSGMATIELCKVA